MAFAAYSRFEAISDRPLFVFLTVVRDFGQRGDFGQRAAGAQRSLAPLHVHVLEVIDEFAELVGEVLADVTVEFFAGYHDFGEDADAVDGDGAACEAEADFGQDVGVHFLHAARTAEADVFFQAVFLDRWFVFIVIGGGEGGTGGAGVEIEGQGIFADF